MGEKADCPASEAWAAFWRLVLEEAKRLETAGEQAAISIRR